MVRDGGAGEGTGERLGKGPGRAPPTRQTSGAVGLSGAGSHEVGARTAAWARDPEGLTRILP